MKKLLLAGTFLCLCLAPVTWSYCYVSSTCFDSDRNETITKAKTWLTSACEKCTCSSYTAPVKFCFEVDLTPDQNRWVGRNSLPQEQKNNNEPEAASQQNEWMNVREIVLPLDKAKNFECPEIPGEFFNKDLEEIIFPVFKQVNYVTIDYSMECCATYGAPRDVDENCKAKWIQEECRFEVVEKTTGNPCQVTNLSMVGK